jgi:hypothetical protein
MAKSEPTVKLLTFNKAQKYLSDNGHTVSTQQVRHLARTNPIVSAAVEDYVDAVTEATAKVIRQSALDEYLAWRRDNPEHIGRGGNRKIAGPKPAHILVDAAQLNALNAVLTANGFNEAAFPVRKPRKAKNASASTNGVAPMFDDNISSDVDLSELELIDIA